MRTPSEDSTSSLNEDAWVQELLDLMCGKQITSVVFVEGYFYLETSEDNRIFFHWEVNVNGDGIQPLEEQAGALVSLVGAHIHCIVTSPTSVRVEFSDGRSIEIDLAAAHQRQPEAFLLGFTNPPHGVLVW